MIKIRIMGTKYELLWVKSILEKSRLVEIISISEEYENIGRSKYYRMYVDLLKWNKAKKIKNLDEFKRKQQEFYRNKSMRKKRGEKQDNNKDVA